MLAIRLQRTGRKGHAQFRLIVQESRLSPTSGKVVVSLGNYDPHTKVAAFDKEKAAFYLEHGAQPSDRVAVLLKKEGVKLPKWVEVDLKKSGKLRNADKLRRNRPDEPKAPAEEAASEEVAPAEAEAAPAEAAEAAAPEAVEPKAAEPAEVAEVPAKEPAETAETEAKTEDSATEEPKQD